MLISNFLQKIIEKSFKASKFIFQSQDDWLEVAII